MSTNETVEKYMPAIKIVGNIVMFLGCAGFIVWCIYKLPIYELLQIFFVLVIIPVMFLVACNVVATQTLLGMWQIVTMGKDQLIKIVEERGKDKTA